VAPRQLLVSGMTFDVNWQVNGLGGPHGGRATNPAGPGDAATAGPWRDFSFRCSPRALSWRASAPHETRLPQGCSRHPERV
jgi:hypothetical protein